MAQACRSQGRLGASVAEPLDASAPWRPSPWRPRRLGGGLSRSDSFAGHVRCAKHDAPGQAPQRTRLVRPPPSRCRLRAPHEAREGCPGWQRAVPRAEPVFDESERNLVERGRPRGDSPPLRGGSGAGHEGEEKHRGPPQPGRAAWIHVGVEAPQPFAAAAFSLAFLAKAVRLSALARRVDLRPFTCGPSSPPTSCSTTRSVASPRRRLSSFTMRV